MVPVLGDALMTVGALGDTWAPLVSFDALFVIRVKAKCNKSVLR
jgi:hypothetical protein